ncbi:hypothetical protein [Variovorax guangxiensis]|uniref:hypothetical protein n=1 Tax=Variovorax guangxiensis TaxID=1775474 RepID=UPI0028585CAC|nr:hypothetical protein [Variovorax guangxiensis]MDR6859540.1 hypothetical protein [Variovorax guangxiensis]
MSSAFPVYSKTGKPGRRWVARWRELQTVDLGHRLVGDQQIEWLTRVIRSSSQASASIGL